MEDGLRLIALSHAPESLVTELGSTRGHQLGSVGERMPASARRRCAGFLDSSLTASGRLPAAASAPAATVTHTRIAFSSTAQGNSTGVDSRRCAPSPVRKGTGDGEPNLASLSRAPFGLTDQPTQQAGAPLLHPPLVAALLVPLPSSSFSLSAQLVRASLSLALARAPTTLAAMADYSAADPEKGHTTFTAGGEKGAADAQVVLRGLDAEAPEGAVHRASSRPFTL